jgi:hypothetical protein
MIEATRRKLGEARFFYGQRQHFMHDPAAFRYYFRQRREVFRAQPPPAEAVRVGSLS